MVLVDILQAYEIYSRTCLERPPLLSSKSGLSRQVVSHNMSYKHQLETIRAYENGRSRRVVARDGGRTIQVIEVHGSKNPIDSKLLTLERF